MPSRSGADGGACLQVGRWAGGLGGVRWSPSPQWAPETGLKMVRGVGQAWTENKCNQRWLAGGPGRRPPRSTHHAPPASRAGHRTFRGATIFPPSTCDRCEAIQKHRTTRPSWRFPESPGRRGGERGAERGAERARVGTSPWWFNLECSLIACPSRRPVPQSALRASSMPRSR